MSPGAEFRRVVVFGGSDAAPGGPVWSEAREVGRRSAEAGWTVVSGGYGGVMEAASAGAREGGGEAIGVLCEAFSGPGNPHLSRSILTADLYSRLRQLIDLGDGFVVFPGSTGTLVELALVWELMNKGLAPLRPVVCLGDFWRPVVEMFGGESTRDSRLAPGGAPERKGQVISRAANPAQVIEILIAHGRG